MDDFFHGQLGAAFRGGISDPDTESEDGDQKGQRDGEEDQIDRRDALTDHGSRSDFRWRFGIVPETGGGA